MSSVFIVQVMQLDSQSAAVTVCCASKFAGIPSTVRRSTCWFCLNSAKLVLTTAAAKLPVAGSGPRLRPPNPSAC